MSADDALDNRVPRAYDDTRLKQPKQPRTAHGAVSYPAAKVLTFAVCLWALLETPWEISPGDSGTQTFALLAAKLLLTGTALLALQGSSLARLLFVFLCGSSLIAVGSSLPFEYMASPRLFGLSFVECALKAGLLLAYILPHLRQTSIAR